jgi:LPS sulfotransferase NodH
MGVKFVVVGAPRTGSTLLVKTLNSVDGIRCHGELLNMRFVRGYDDGFEPLVATKEEREERHQQLLVQRNNDPVAFILKALTSDQQATGFKALYSAILEPAWLGVMETLAQAQDVHFIHLIRRNHLRRFVSERILMEGGPNHSGAGGKSDRQLTVEISIEEYQQRCVEIEAEMARIGSVLDGHSVFELSYEDLSRDTAGAVTGVCHFLGLDTSAQDIEPALSKVGASDLRDTVSNFQQLLEHPDTRELAMSD